MKTPQKATDYALHRVLIKCPWAKAEWHHITSSIRSQHNVECIHPHSHEEHNVMCAHKWCTVRYREAQCSGASAVLKPKTVCCSMLITFCVIR